MFFSPPLPLLYHKEKPCHARTEDGLIQTLQDLERNIERKITYRNIRVVKHWRKRKHSLAKFLIRGRREGEKNSVLSKKKTFLVKEMLPLKYNYM